MHNSMTPGHQRQAGMGLWGFSFNVLLLGTFLVLILRVAPSYFTYLTVKDVIERAAGEYDPQRDTVYDVRVRLNKLLTTSQVYDVNIEDIEISRERGRLVIDATYERRFPLIWIIDGVMRFDDLVVETP